MARELHVYPKVALVGAEWTFIINVYEHVTRVTSRFVHVIPAGLTATTDLHELKYSFDLTVDDLDTDQDVDDALFLDDIRNGPQVETVIGNWIVTAETNIAGLSDPYTLADYWASWSLQDTNTTRNDGRTALINGRGWTVSEFHQHEGDGSNTDG